MSKRSTQSLSNYAVLDTKCSTLIAVATNGSAERTASAIFGFVCLRGVRSSTQVRGSIVPGRVVGSSAQAKGFVFGVLGEWQSPNRAKHLGSWARLSSGFKKERPLLPVKGSLLGLRVDPPNMHPCVSTGHEAKLSLCHQ